MVVTVVGGETSPGAQPCLPPLQLLVDQGHRLTQSSNKVDGGSVFLCQPSPCACDQAAATAYVWLTSSGSVGLACLCCYGKYTVFVAADAHWRRGAS